MDLQVLLLKGSSEVIDQLLLNMHSWFLPMMSMCVVLRLFQVTTLGFQVHDLFQEQFPLPDLLLFLCFPLHIMDDLEEF
jgi:hypothetical protein